jgi:hypothetical protein
VPRQGGGGGEFGCALESTIPSPMSSGSYAHMSTGSYAKPTPPPSTSGLVAVTSAVSPVVSPVEVGISRESPDVSPIALVQTTRDEEEEVTMEEGKEEDEGKGEGEGAGEGAGEGEREGLREEEREGGENDPVHNLSERELAHQWAETHGHHHTPVIPDRVLVLEELQHAASQRVSPPAHNSLSRLAQPKTAPAPRRCVCVCVCVTRKICTAIKFTCICVHIKSTCICVHMYVYMRTYDVYVYAYI